MRSLHLDLDGPVHVADFGGSGRPMLLLHGLGGSHLNWAAAGPLLARRHRVLALDLAGFGRTPLGERTADLRGNSRLLGRFVSEHFDEAPVLVGNSMGGLLALLHAAERPAAIAGLVLVNAAVPQPVGPTLDLWVAASFGAVFLPFVGEAYLAALRRWRTPEQMVAVMLQACCASPDRVPSPIREELIRFARDRPSRPWSDAAYLQAARSLLRMVLDRPGFDSVVEKVRAPTLVYAGALDRLIPRVATERLAQLRPDWDFRLVEDVGHVPQLEDPEGFAEVVGEWAASLPGEEAPEPAWPGAHGAGADGWSSELTNGPSSSL